MNFNPYSNPNYVFANRQQQPTSSNSNSSSSNKLTTTSQVSSQVSSSPSVNETNKRSAIPKLDAVDVKNLAQEIEEELSSPKHSNNNSNNISNNSSQIIVTPKSRGRSQSRLVNLDKDSDDEETSKTQDQVRTILTVEVTVIKPATNGWRTVSNSSLLSLYSSERKQALTSEVEIPTEMALWRESQKKKGFDLYLFLKLNENVQFQILKSVQNDDSNSNSNNGSSLLGSSYLVIKYVDKRSEKIQFIGLLFSTVADLQSTYNLLQRCIASVPTIPVSSISSVSMKNSSQLPPPSQSPSCSSAGAGGNKNDEQQQQELKNNESKMNSYKKIVVDHVNDQILYHTKQMCYHELQKEELLKQLQKLENE